MSFISQLGKEDEEDEDKEKEKKCYFQPVDNSRPSVIGPDPIVLVRTKILNAAKLGEVFTFPTVSLLSSSVTYQPTGSIPLTKLKFTLPLIKLCTNTLLNSYKYILHVGQIHISIGSLYHHMSPILLNTNTFID